MAAESASGIPLELIGLVTPLPASEQREFCPFVGAEARR
jgi:hypothetical protein